MILSIDKRIQLNLSIEMLRVFKKHLKVLSVPTAVHRAD
jgi:hypothetical protein